MFHHLHNLDSLYDVFSLSNNFWNKGIFSHQVNQWLAFFQHCNFSVCSTGPERHSDNVCQTSSRTTLSLAVWKTTMPPKDGWCSYNRTWKLRESRTPGVCPCPDPGHAVLMFITLSCEKFKSELMEHVKKVRAVKDLNVGLWDFWM